MYNYHFFFILIYVPGFFSMTFFSINIQSLTEIWQSRGKQTELNIIRIQAC
jgi:hypothetical protein